MLSVSFLPYNYTPMVSWWSVSLKLRKNYAMKKYLLKLLLNNKSTARSSGAFYATRVYKPGSVLTAIYLALRLLARSSRLLEAVGQTCCFSTALLRDRVYIVKPVLPQAGWALTPPFHPGCAEAQWYISVALVLRSPSAGVTRYPCPAEPGLSSFGAFRPPSAAVRPGRENIVAQTSAIVKSPCKFFYFRIYYCHRNN